MTRFSQDLLDVPDFQAIQFSIFTFPQIRHYQHDSSYLHHSKFYHHWSKTAGTAVDNDHTSSLHLCIIPEQLLLRCQLFSKSVGHIERRRASRMSSGNWSPVRYRWRCSKISQAWMVCARSSILAAFGGDKICLLSSRLLPAANGSQRAANFRHCSLPFVFLILRFQLRILKMTEIHQLRKMHFLP